MQNSSQGRVLNQVCGGDEIKHFSRVFDITACVERDNRDSGEGGGGGVERAMIDTLGH